MCYSAEVSFLTWGFGMVCAAFLTSTGKSLRDILFPFVVIQMQLVEGLRWTKALDDKTLSILGKIALYLQPLALMIEARIGAPWIVLYVGTQTIFELFYGSRDLTFEIAEDGHFRWNWLNNGDFGVTLPYFTAMMLLLYFVFPLPLFLLSWGILAYYYARHGKYGTHGSLWCNAAVILWIYYLFR